MAKQARTHGGWAALVLVLAAFSVACGGTTQQVGKGESKSAVLVVSCNVPEAEVWINSRYSRSAGELARGLRMSPGSYRLEVRHSGYHSRYFELDLAAQERRVVEVELARRFH
jgi:hypothetical protein